MACQTKKFKFCTQQLANLGINVKEEIFLVTCMRWLDDDIAQKQNQYGIVDIKVDHC